MKAGLKLIGLMLVISVLVPVLPASTTVAADSRSILGTWHGEYNYTGAEGDSRYPPTNFTLIIQTVEKNTVLGNVIEPRTNFGPSHLKDLPSSVYGIWDPKFGKIRFIKTLQFPGGHSIYYEGTLGADGRLAGTWIITEDWTGTWSAGK